MARQAEVSPTTVSHVLSGNRPVAASTRERVEAAIEGLGYRPNGLARSLRMQRSHTIGLIIPDITNPFYPVLARGLDDALARRYRTFVCNTDAVREREVEFTADALDRGVDGLVLVAFQISAHDVEDILQVGTPVVSCGDSITDPRVDVVLTDDEHGALEATRHLIRRGHRRVGMIGGGEGPGRRRMAGYRRALAEAGIRFRRELVASGGWTRPGGASAMRALLAAKDRPTAVFSANDLMAIGAMDAAREAGLVLPRDLALVGFDDIEAASLVTPALTTVINPAYEAGETAGRLLLDRITGSHRGKRRKVVLPTRLVERESA